MLKTSKRIVVILAMALLVVTPLSGNAAPSGEGMYTTVERFGIGYTGLYNMPLQSFALSKLEINGTFPFGWYSDWWTTFVPEHPYGMEYAQLIKVGPRYYDVNGPSSGYWAVLGGIVASNPGATWFIGNEPERKLVQDDRTPEEYARIYHDLRDFIKGRDENAKVYVGGVVQASRLRMKWLDAVLASYQALYEEPMPVDGWSIHEQILPEIDGSWGAEVPKGITDGEHIGLDLNFADNASVALFEEQVTNFRQWMKDHGYQDKPLIISEYGVLLPSNLLGEGAGDDAANIAAGDQMVKDFMTGTFDFLLDAVNYDTGYAADGYRLVQRWLWYSLNDRPYTPGEQESFNGSLFVYNQPEELTQFGEAFRSYAIDLYGAKTYLPLGMRNAN